MLRRAELNGRSEEDGESPWSIRQTAVYRKLTCDDRSSVSGSTFLLVAPSDNFRSQLKECLESSTADETETLSCWNTHRILCADSLKGWSDYMVWLQKKLKEQVRLHGILTTRTGSAHTPSSQMKLFSQPWAITKQIFPH